MKAALDLAAAPTWIDQREAWPLWRRAFGAAPEDAQVRRDAFERIANPRGRWSSWATAPALSPVDRQREIFQGSRDRLMFGRAERIRGVRGKPDGAWCPPKAISHERWTDRISVDLGQVQAISRSKCRDRFFSVDDFGESYRRFKQFPLTAAGLRAALDWGEIRIFGDSPSDHFSIDLWDGRLFLDNNGGSHHIAAAIRIAQAIGAALPACAKLIVYEADTAAIRELATQHIALFEGNQGRSPALTIAQALGCEAFVIPAALEQEWLDLVVFPKDLAGSAGVVSLLNDRGVVFANDWLLSVAQQQQAHIDRGVLAELKGSES